MKPGTGTPAGSGFVQVTGRKFDAVLRGFACGRGSAASSLPSPHRRAPACGRGRAASCHPSPP
ncbi:hypothetical protein, partial [Corynebacterium bovis]|uniref:hypothetical protein n=1 Tax=Corynebacterium bovis TaxID=36808 RepID=UPI001C8C94C9